MPNKFPRAFIIHTTNDLWINVASKLQNDFDWEMCYLIGDVEKMNALAPTLSNAVLHSKPKAKTYFDPNNKPMSIKGGSNLELLNSLTAAQLMYFQMKDRDSQQRSPKSFQERLRDYFTSVGYWSDTLSKHAPDVIIFGDIPHHSYDYLIYKLCRYFDIQTYVFQYTNVPGVVLIQESFEKGSKELRDTYSKLILEDQTRRVSIPTMADEIYSNLEKPDSTVVPHIRWLREGQPELASENLANQKKLPRRFFVKTGIFVLLDFIKNVMAFREPLRLGQKTYSRIRLIRRQILMGHLKKLIQVPDLDRDFIFVALQTEPECATSPLGRVPGSQLLMIDMLVRSLPDGWLLFVKEHPSQYTFHRCWDASKSTEWYDYANKSEKVVIVDPDEEPAVFIDRARATATIAGTSGWESLFRNTPALLFGYAWYRDCEGAFVIDNTESLRSALSLIENGYEINHRKLKLFLAALDQVKITAYIHPSQSYTMSSDECSSNLALACHQRVQEQDTDCNTNLQIQPV